MITDFRERFSNGRRAMGHLIHVWHERNGWSHRVLPALTDTLDLGRLHSSQISNLRNGKLISPSPEVFFTLGQINIVLHKGLHDFENLIKEKNPELLKILSESSIPIENDIGMPISYGDFFEIFVGAQKLPSSFDWFIEVEESAKLSAALADVLCKGRSWRQCKNEVMSSYPVSKENRRERFASVMAGVRDYSAEELDGELLDLYSTYLTIGETTLKTVDEFLSNLRQYKLNND